MEFGEVPLHEAEGGILAHSVALPQGRLRKGSWISSADLAALQAAGITRLTIARLGPDDRHEDAAALAIAQALVPAPGSAGLDLRPAGTGRVNIHARHPGLAEIRAPMILAVNSVDPAITVATVPEWQRMDQGGMLATVKIIAYGVPGAAVDQAAALGQGALALRQAQRLGVAMIETTVAGVDAGPKGQAAMRARVTRLGARLLPCQRVAHETEALADALRAQKDADMVMILTASATSDIGDTAPEALRRAGGQVAHFGMPVDPGNLLFIGALHGRPVIGLPGCARSPALNGADWVLERLICGIEVGPAEIRQMGVGGLLKEIPTRPRPRDI